ncbi:cation diffusion facilitator family transporter [Pseudoalteromonas denitrificans]|nr:cation diffusion facilitator family transporter [Pseudoalteromonas denitrificans]
MQDKGYDFWVKLASWTAIIMVSLMIMAKVWAWLATGSAAMLGSLTDSLLDITATLINFFVLRYALLPADDDHRYGHGKAEPLAGLAQAAFIAGSACLLAFHGIERLFNPIDISNTGFNIGIAVSIFAIVCTLILVFVQNIVVKKTGSIAIKADSLHYKGDLLLNASVMLAMILASLGWTAADAIFTIGVAFFLLYNAWQVGVESGTHLMDKELPDEDKEEIISLVGSHEKVYGLHDIRTRQAGKTKFIQFHIELDDNLPLIIAHQVADEVETLLKANISGELDIIIHQDPLSVVSKSQN